MIVGKKAPDIHGQAIVNGQIKNISLADFNSKNKVLFFYPSDFSYVCPTELHGFQECIEEFNKRQAVIIGISVDTIESHQAWLNTPKEKGGIRGITYPLLSDITKNISKSYGVLDEESGLAFRGLFILDKNNIVQVAHINNLALGRNTSEALRLLDAIEFTQNYGQFCPANWQPGKEGIEPSEKGLLQYFKKT